MTFGESMIALVVIYNYTNPAVDKFHDKFKKIARKNVRELTKLRLMWLIIKFKLELSPLPLAAYTNERVIFRKHSQICVPKARR